MRYIFPLFCIFVAGGADELESINSLTAQLAEPHFVTSETPTEPPTTKPTQKPKQVREKKKKGREKKVKRRLESAYHDVWSRGFYQATSKLIEDCEEEDERNDGVLRRVLGAVLPKPSIDPNAGLYVKQIPKPPIDVLLEEPDLQLLAKAMQKSPLLMSDGIRKVAATIFAPIDSSFNALPELQEMDKFDVSSIMDTITNVFEFHIVAPRLLTPTMLMGDTNHTTRFTGHTIGIHREEKPSAIGNATLTVEGYANVVEIIQAKRGWIYKIDAMLGPRLNEGPTILEFLETADWMTRMRYLVKQSGILNEKVSRLGPLTILGVPDNGWKIKGMTVPGCLYQTLTRPENEHLLMKLVKWFIIPGLWSYDALNDVSNLPAIQPPQVSVAHLKPALKHPMPIDPATDSHSSVALGRRRRLEELTEFRAMEGSIGLSGTTQGCADRRELLSFTNYSPATFPPPPPEGLGLKEIPNLIAKKKERFKNSAVINLLENREIIATYNIYNGYVHVLSSLPDTSHVFNPFLTLWDCTHEWCYECPLAAHWLLDFFDSGGLLPTGVPLEFVVPPGPRPDWVCKGSSSWFPPGWSKRTWDKYMDAVKEKRTAAARLQQQGAMEAALKLEDLRYRLADARVKLERIQVFSHLDTQDLRPLWDPQSLISVISSRHMSATLLPSCRLKDDRQRITMDDLEYIARWARCDSCAGRRKKGKK